MGENTKSLRRRSVFGGTSHAVWLPKFRLEGKSRATTSFLLFLRSARCERSGGESG